jgi:hypothetical protein
MSFSARSNLLEVHQIAPDLAKGNVPQSVCVIFRHELGEAQPSMALRALPRISMECNKDSAASRSRRSLTRALLPSCGAKLRVHKQR